MLKQIYVHYVYVPTHANYGLQPRTIHYIFESPTIKKQTKKTQNPMGKPIFPTRSVRRRSLSSSSMLATFLSPLRMRAEPRLALLSDILDRLTSMTACSNTSKNGTRKLKMSQISINLRYAVLGCEAETLIKREVSVSIVVRFTETEAIK